MNLKLMKLLCRMDQTTLLEMMIKYLEEKYNNVIAEASYVVALGQIPVALVAHLDTVGQVPPRHIYYDQKEHVMWSPELLGADDRAGVYSIIQIIEQGYRPSIIFTTDEEVGAIGAQTLVSQILNWPEEPLKAIIELDRQGKNDCVFYQCDNKKFESYIRSFGFQTALGSFTDISIIAPQWSVAAVNLSIGYENEHNVNELLHIDWMNKTIDKVIKILDDIDNREYFKYIPNKYYQSLYSMFQIDKDKCFICNAKLNKKNRVLTPDSYYACKECYDLYYK